VRICSILATICCLAGLCRADLVVVVDPPVPLGQGLSSYTVRLVADVEEDQASSFDGAFTGPMNQVWVGGAATPTLTVASALSPDEAARDSHLLLFDAELSTVFPPSEDGPGTGSYLGGPGGGHMAIGINAPAQSLDLAFAQIVVPDGQMVVLEGDFGLNDTGRGVHLVAVVPEPATLVLLAAGACLAFRRRVRARGA